MRTYVFTIMESGKRWQDEVKSSDKFTAEKVLKGRYPKAVISFKEMKS